MLADRLAARTVAGARERGVEIDVSVIELRTLANEIAAGLVSQINGPGLNAAIEKLAEADGIIAATPIYKAGVSGLFKSFFDLLDNDLLIAKPVGAGGDRRHRPPRAGGRRGDALALRLHARAHRPDLALRRDRGLGRHGARGTDRARRAGAPAADGERLAEQIRAASWGSYQHQYGSAGGAELEIDLDSDLMRLATGGRNAGSERLADGPRGLVCGRWSHHPRSPPSRRTWRRSISMRTPRSFSNPASRSRTRRSNGSRPRPRRGRAASSTHGSRRGSSPIPSCEIFAWSTWWPRRCDAANSACAAPSSTGWR